MIFERVADRAQTVGELAAGLPVSRPAVSQHLKVLKDAGLVVDQPAGNRRIYRVDPEGMAAFRAQLDGFWSKTLAAYCCPPFVLHTTASSAVTTRPGASSSRWRADRRGDAAVGDEA